MYCKCKPGVRIPQLRLDMGYKTCVDCSTTKTYSYVPIIEHKTGNTIQIVSQEVSASVHRAWRRKYGREMVSSKYRVVMRVIMQVSLRFGHR